MKYRFRKSFIALGVVLVLILVQFIWGNSMESSETREPAGTESVGSAKVDAAQKISDKTFSERDSLALDQPNYDEREQRISSTRKSMGPPLKAARADSSKQSMESLQQDAEAPIEPPVDPS